MWIAWHNIILVLFIIPYFFRYVEKHLNNYIELKLYIDDTHGSSIQS